MVVTWRGMVPYVETLDAQRRYRDEVIAGREPEALWLLEHPPVITTGRRDVAIDAARVADAGYQFVATERGGLATCHEPGQLVGYCFVDGSRRGIRAIVAGLELGIVGWLATLGVLGADRPAHPGVWVGRDKVCAIGLHVRRGVTMHGFALNLVNDLTGFGLITPCGIVEGGVTSVKRLRGAAPTPKEASAGVGAFVAGALAAG